MKHAVPTVTPKEPFKIVSDFTNESKILSYAILIFVEELNIYSGQYLVMFTLKIQANKELDKHFAE